MPLRVGNLTIDPPVVLAPMAGITDAPFRRLAARFGVGLVVSEMVASGEMLANRPAARARAEVADCAAPVAVQLAGREPKQVAEAARIAEAGGAALIDLNFGCPARKVTGGMSGAALMREPDRALRLLDAALGAVSIPVTVKMRLGWDGLTAPDLAARLTAAGAAMVTVHGRTRAQFYDGAADWRAVGAVGRAIAAPLVVNGDVRDTASARAALAASGAGAVMIGRAARGRPWLPAAIAAGLAGCGFEPPDLAARRDLLLGHHEAMLSFYGVRCGVRAARKHLVWALEDVAGAGPLRRRIVRLDDPGAVRAALVEGFSALIGEGRRAA